MIIVLSGPDTYRSRERLQQLREAFLQKYDPSGVNVTVLDSDNLRFETFQSAVTSQGFLSSRRFVVLERPLSLDSKIQERISTFLADGQVPEETIFVCWLDDGERATGRKKKAASGPSGLARQLQAAKHREVFDALEPHEVESWMASYVKRRRGNIERSAIRHLAAAVGSNLWLAANELDKLLHRNRGTITEQDARASIAAEEEANIFEFTDALSRKDSRRALGLLERQLNDGANELYLLTMLFRQIRILLSVGDIASSEPNAATIAARLKLHPFVAQKALQQVRTFSQSELLAAHDRLIDVDRQMKSTRVNPRALLELFVVKTCRP